MRRFRKYILRGIISKARSFCFQIPYSAVANKPQDWQIVYIGFSVFLAFSFFFLLQTVYSFGCLINHEHIWIQGRCHCGPFLAAGHQHFKEILYSIQSINSEGKFLKNVVSTFAYQGFLGWDSEKLVSLLCHCPSSFALNIFKLVSFFLTRMRQQQLVIHLMIW